MSKTKKKKDIKEIHSEFVEEEQYKRAMLDLKSSYTRGRSLTVGTAFGGVTEISMRGEGDRRLWVLMQPVEVVELIHQLAANIGCHIHVQPRKDFSSWRQWNEKEEFLPNAGWAPFSEQPPIAKITSDPEEQAGFEIKPKKKRVKRTN